MDVSYQVFDVEKVYSYDESMSTAAANDIQDGKDYFEYSFVRKRSYKKTNSSSSSGIACGLTTVRVDKKTGTETVVKSIISMREYNSSVKSRDMTRHIIKQTRISFFSGNCRVLWCIYIMNQFRICVYSIVRQMISRVIVLVCLHF